MHYTEVDEDLIDVVVEWFAERYHLDLMTEDVEELESYLNRLGWK